MKKDPFAFAWARNIVLKLNDLTDGKSNTFEETAVWPDDIKEPGMRQFDNFHFYDKIHNKDGILISVNETSFKYNSAELLRRAKLVFSKKTNKVDFIQSMMMRYVFHVIGDMHQPLHNI